MSPTSQRPFWKRKRWIAAAVLWLVVAYPALLGPTIYAARRGWFPQAVQEVFIPVLPLQHAPIIGGPYADYLLWWWDAAPDQPVGHEFIPVPPSL